MKKVDSLRLIATEEAFAIPEYSDAMKKLIDDGVDDLDLYKMWFSGEAPAPDSDAWVPWWMKIMGEAPKPGEDDGWIEWWTTTRTRLFDLGDVRLRVMDEAKIDMFVLSLVSPGVQLFDADTATSMATLTNDALAEAVRRHPTRFAGLASFAPQDPKRAAKEIERAIKDLGLNGLIVNSHTKGEYLDDPKFYPIFEAACAVDAAIYIHPRNPPRDALKMLTLGNGTKITEVTWGYGMEVGVHAARLLYSDVFKEFPNLKIVLGHMGENIPYYLFRMDWASQFAPVKPSERFKKNIWITTSGCWNYPLCHDVLEFCRKTLGPDRILFAVDYPFGESNTAASFMREAPLSRDDLEKIAFKNTEELFKIGGRDR
jgi:5-carboxyvanillate decarboxylase